MRYFLLVLLIVIFIGNKVLAASVVNSVHNLSLPPHIHDANIGDPDWTDYNEVCIYCHTPHNATVSVPLWNRQLTESTSFTPYASNTLRANAAYPSVTSLLCLSCHDGTMALDAIGNVGSSPIDPQNNRHSKMSGDCMYCHGAQYWNECHGCDTDNDFQGTVIGLDLSDDHPVSIHYLESADLKPKPLDDRFENGVRLINGKVECPSCHNVHDPQIRPFLRTSNAGSELCYTCHDK